MNSSMALDSLYNQALQKCCYGFGLPFRFVLLKLKLSKKRETSTSHLKVWLKLGFKLNHLLKNRAQKLVKDDFCWSSGAQQVPGGTLAIVLDIPCGTKFLREFVFADWRFFVFCGNNIFAIRTDWFFKLGINFCDFQKVLSTQHW